MHKKRSPPLRRHPVSANDYVLPDRVVDAAYGGIWGRRREGGAMQIPAPQYKRQGEEAECPIRFPELPGNMYHVPVFRDLPRSFRDAAFGGIWVWVGRGFLSGACVHIDDVKNFLFKAVIRKRLCRVESKRACFAHDRACLCPERRPLDAVEDGAGKKAAGDLCILSPD